MVAATTCACRTSAATSWTAADDVVDGASVSCSGRPVTADMPPELVVRTCPPSGGAITPPELVDTHATGGRPATRPRPEPVGGLTTWLNRSS